MNMRRTTWRQYLLLGAAVVMTCCQLFHAHGHPHGIRSDASAAREPHAAFLSALLPAADLESDTQTGFCPICAGVFVSDVPPAALPPLVMKFRAAASPLVAAAAPARFFPLPPGRAPPVSNL